MLRDANNEKHQVRTIATDNTIKTLKNMLQNVEDEPGKKQKSQVPTVCVAENSQAESLYNSEQEIANYGLCTPKRQNTLHARYRSPEQQEKEEEKEDTHYETSAFNPFFEKPSVNEDDFKENKKENMWKLETSGRVVEEELYNLGRGLEFEHGAHSFIVGVDDELIKQHFSEAEHLEMENECVPEIPQLSQDIIDYLIKFNDKKTLKEIRKAINEPDERFDMKYDQDAYHNLDYIRFALYALVREIENGGLKGQNLEAWYNCHVWNVIIDQGFADLKETSVVRRIGNGERDEYGIDEAGKLWFDDHGTKFLKETCIKSPKFLKDMLLKLMKKVPDIEGNFSDALQILAGETIKIVQSKPTRSDVQISENFVQAGIKKRS
ncbi:15745_t:CDS:2 [Entrophospora sp. SA101]|nr:15745_t:CDS:2 [Entrophospora sp. SA101]